MSSPQEHDYIGLSEASSMEGSDKISSSSSTVSVEEEDGKSNNALNLKETELRLGLPGSESPERKHGGGGGCCVLGRGGVVEENKSGWVLKSLVSGAKRGFSDAIDGSGKWPGFSGSGGSDAADLGKGGGLLFSPRGGSNGKSVVGGLESGGGAQQMGQSPVSKDVGPSPPKPSPEKKPQVSSAANEHGAAPASKAQVVGWPPVRSFRRNTMASNPILYVKVSMDGAPYLRKVDLKIYSNYVELSSALEKMFSCFTIGQCGSHGVPGREGLTESRLMDLLHGSEYVLTYEDKDGDWMLVGDVPWEMFTDSCRRLRIMKGSEAIGLAPRAMEKCKNRN